jgi:hypothetical protein
MSLKSEHDTVGKVMSDMNKKKVLEKHEKEQAAFRAEEDSRMKAALAAFRTWNGAWTKEFNCVLVSSFRGEGIGPNGQIFYDIGIKPLPKK